MSGSSPAPAGQHRESASNNSPSQLRQNPESVLNHLSHERTDIYWWFWQGQLTPYAPQAKRALHANLATALFLNVLRQVVDSTVGGFSSVG